MKARKDIRRSVYRVKISDKVDEDVFAVRNRSSEIEHVGIRERDDDEQSHAGHQHVRGLAREYPAPDSDGDHADDKVRKPERIRDDEYFNDRDHVIDGRVDEMEIISVVEALHPEECGHVYDHVYCHRKQCHDDIKDLFYKALITGLIQNMTPTEIILRSIPGSGTRKHSAYYNS